MRKNKLLTIFCGAGICISDYTAHHHHRDGVWRGNAITFPIESFSMKWFLNVFSLKSFGNRF